MPLDAGRSCDALPGDLVEQRRVIDEWRRDYNEERPHEALGDVPPALVYRRSPRGYPRKLIKAEPAAWNEACDVDRTGCFRWRKHKFFLTGGRCKGCLWSEV
jgi:hypothetical protein